MEVYTLNNFIDFNSQELMSYFNRQPSSVKGQVNSTTLYYKRILYNLLYSVFEWKLPKEWKENYFRYWLYRFGSIGIVYTNEYGWVCQPYSIVKLDLYYQPKVIQIYNQFITKPKVGVIGENAEIIKAFDDFYGFEDIISNYAEKLAQCDKSINISLMNSNVTYSAEVENKKDAEALKLAYEKATTGEPFVVLNKNILNDKGIVSLFPNVKNNFIAPDVMQLKRSIINEFLTTIGIKNANYDKKERLNSQEVTENNDETRALISVIYDNLKECCDRVNEITDIEIDVKLRYNYEGKGGVSNDDVHIVGA